MGCNLKVGGAFCTVLVGLVLVVVGVYFGGAVEEVKAAVVDAVFVDNDSEESSDCTSCKLEDEDCTVTCEKDQVRWYLSESDRDARRRSHTRKPSKYSYHVYSVQNPVEVIGGAKPVVDYVDPIEVLELVKGTQIGEMENGKLRYTESSRYSMTCGSKCSAEEIEKFNAHLATKVVVPHAQYHVAINTDNMGGALEMVVLASGVKTLSGMVGPALDGFKPQLEPAIPMVGSLTGVNMTMDENLLLRELVDGAVSSLLSLSPPNTVPDMGYLAVAAAMMMGAPLTVPVALTAFNAGCGVTKPVSPCGLELMDQPNFAGIGPDPADPASAWTPRQLRLTDEEAAEVWGGLYGPTATTETMVGVLMKWQGMMAAETPGSLQYTKIALFFKHMATLSHFALRFASGVPAEQAQFYPYFMEVTLGELMGTKGADEEGYLEDMDAADGAGMAIGLGLLQSSTSAETGEYVLQMGNAGEAKDAKAFQYYTEVGSQTQVCTADPDCVAQPAFMAAYQASLAGGVEDVSSCTADEACTPEMVEGYRGSAVIPGGSLWENDRAVGSLAKLQIYIPGIGRAVLSRVGSGSTDWDGVQVLRYVVSSVGDRRENCDGTGAGSPGQDCASPERTVYLGHRYTMNQRPPLYQSTVDLEIPDVPEQAELRASSFYTQGVYNPAEKVTFKRKAPVAPLIEIRAEESSGLIIFGHKPLLTTMRIRPSMLFDKVEDAILPLSIVVEGDEVTAAEHDKMQQLQGVEGLAELAGLLLIIGGVLVALGAIAGVYVAMAGRAKPAAESSARDVKPSAEVEGAPTLVSA